MSDPTSPPIPPPLIPPPPPRTTVPYAQPGTTPSPGSLEQYNRIAETVGMVPSLRLRDNLIQLAVVAIGTVIGALVGYLVFADPDSGTPSALPTVIGALAGLVISGVISGFVLMILGFTRRRR